MAYVIPFDQVPNLVKKYKGEYMAEQSTERGKIWFIRSSNNFMLVQNAGGKARVSFHKDCPCDRI